MSQFRSSFRVGVLFLVIALMLGIFSLRLYSVQVVDGAEESSKPEGSFTYQTRVPAARGQILDRNGTVLVGNRASFNINLVYEVLFSGDEPNEDLRRLTNLAAERGLEIVDHLPVTPNKPYEYRFDDFSSVWSDHLRTWLSERDWDTDISAPQLIRKMRDRWNIPEYWSEDEARRVMSVRYELELRHCTNLPVYVVLEDVDPDSLAMLMELNVPGANVETSTVREYHTDYAAHILGTVGPMDSVEYEKYKELGYAMDAYVGKSGFEAAFEEELHGTDGLRETTIAADGTILEEYYVVEPKAGNNVELTIDINLQQDTEEAVRIMMEDLQDGGLNEYHSGQDAEGAAAVVMLVDTGEVIASVSYPTFDLKTYQENYNEILKAEDNPLINRALESVYPPGSIFKPVTTIAGLESKAISPDVEIDDKGIYRRFEDEGYLPRCMVWTTSQATHGVIGILRALQVSCNYFFYEVGYRTGIEEMDRIAKGMGLGEKTGVELYEARGHRANPEVKADLYEGYQATWYGSDTVSAAIGQSEHLYTPIQLCSYAATLANQGVRYKATFLRRIIAADYSDLLMEMEPTVLSKLEISQETYDIYTEGMYRSATYGTAAPFLMDMGMAICAKTGTAEHGSGGSDNASFIVFAPKEDPVIAISVYVEKGANSSNLGQVARAVLKSYFAQESYEDTFPGENRIS